MYLVVFRLDLPDPLAEPDWSLQRSIYLDGATFVPPSSRDRAPIGEDTTGIVKLRRAVRPDGASALTGCGPVTDSSCPA